MSTDTFCSPIDTFVVTLQWIWHIEGWDIEVKLPTLATLEGVLRPRPRLPAYKPSLSQTHRSLGHPPLKAQGTDVEFDFCRDQMLASRLRLRYQPNDDHNGRSVMYKGRDSRPDLLESQQARCP